MSKLSDKEIAYFSDQLPDGMAVVDFRGIENRMDFVKTYTPKEYDDLIITNCTEAEKAIEIFISQVKKK